jgi:subtilisin family serine protease
VEDARAILANPAALVTVTPGDGPAETGRQRTRDQVRAIIAADPRLLVDSDDLADFGFICDRDHVLLPPEDPDPNADAVNVLVGYLSDRFAGQSDDEPADTDLTGIGELPDLQPRTGLSRRYRLPTRRVPVPGGRDLLVTLDEIDRDLGVGFARPDHLVHVAVRGKPTVCPATEPAETGRADGPWPPVNTTPGQLGAGVSVVVVDSGWYPPAGALPWMGGVTGQQEPQPIPDPPGDLREYAGHGTFVAGVVRAMAPECTLHVLSLHVDPSVPGGGVLESELVQQLDAALAHEPRPDLINLSAGCPTRLNLPARALEDWWADVSPELDLVLVAAAGNNASPWEFWPASFPWAVGVGSLDRDGQVSDFSNWGDSVDVLALGRNLVNAFPRGRYVCQESPDRGDERFFDNLLARWSGTSFAAPLVTGMIAAALSAQPASQRSASLARDQVLAVTPRVKTLKARQAPIVSESLLVPRQPS